MFQRVTLKLVVVALLAALSFAVASARPPDAKAAAGVPDAEFLKTYIKQAVHLAIAGPGWGFNPPGGDGSGLEMPDLPFPGIEGDIYVGPDGEILECHEPAGCGGQHVPGGSNGEELPDWLRLPGGVWQPLRFVVIYGEEATPQQIDSAADEAAEAWAQLAETHPDGPCWYWSEYGQFPTEGWEG